GRAGSRRRRSRRRAADCGPRGALGAGQGAAHPRLRQGQRRLACRAPPFRRRRRRGHRGPAAGRRGAALACLGHRPAERW
ncbi:unnamed protein product, partial [Prorocentrum cordatum]